MRIMRMDIESEFFGNELFSVEDIHDEGEFRQAEESLISSHNPYYIQSSVDAKDILSIHKLENLGFRFVEFRYKKMLDVHSFHKVDELAYYPYMIMHINQEEMLESAVDILRNSIQDDRFSMDPQIDKEAAKKRLEMYLRKSFDKKMNESVYGLFNKNSRELVAVKSVLRSGDNKVIFGQTALKTDIDQGKFTYMFDSLLISNFLNANINLIYAITSAMNLSEIELHVSKLKFKVESANVILRKLYR